MPGKRGLAAACGAAAVLAVGGPDAVAYGAARPRAAGQPPPAVPVAPAVDPMTFRGTAPGPAAQIVGGLAAPPAAAPPPVQAVIWAANQIVGLPYRYGGGHGAILRDTAYDCSGAVSFALRGAGLLRTPLASTALGAWGSQGAGRWITVFANAGHAYLEVAGIRLDTSRADDPGGLTGPRWRPVRTSSRGYRLRHPAGL